MTATSHDHLSSVQQKLHLATTKQNTFQVSIEEFRRMQTHLLELREALYAAQDREAKMMQLLDKSTKNRFWPENLFQKRDVTATLKENMALRRELDMKEQQLIALRSNLHHVYSLYESAEQQKTLTEEMVESYDSAVDTEHAQTEEEKMETVKEKWDMDYLEHEVRRLTNVIDQQIHEIARLKVEKVELMEQVQFLSQSHYTTFTEPDVENARSAQLIKDLQREVTRLDKLNKSYEKDLLQARLQLDEQLQLQQIKALKNTVDVLEKETIQKSNMIQALLLRMGFKDEPSKETLPWLKENANVDEMLACANQKLQLVLESLVAENCSLKEKSAP